MFTFIHMTNKTVTEIVNGTKSVKELSFPEELSVPTTMAELAALDGGPMVEIGVGSGDKATTLSVPQVVRDYISGRKLRSNQEQQAENKVDSAEKIARAKVEAWYGSTVERLKEIWTKSLSNKSPKGRKAYNDWLDSVYLANKDEIDKL